MTGHMSAVDAQQQRQSARAGVPRADAVLAAPGKTKGLSAAASRSYSVVGTDLAWQLAQLCTGDRGGQVCVPCLLKTAACCALQAQHWEQLAVLSNEQQMAVDLISQHCAERPAPHVSLPSAYTGRRPCCAGAVWPKKACHSAAILLPCLNLLTACIPCTAGRGCVRRRSGFGRWT